jgi:phosphoribosylformylglycinamidine synthase
MDIKLPRVCIVTGCGINADRELAEAFSLSGFLADRVHVFDLRDNPAMLGAYTVLAFPGGFSFGDHLGSGKVLAYLVKSRMKEGLEAFVEAGGLVLGICNGFQTLVKMGILPNLSGHFTQDVSLIHNESGLFDDRWVEVRYNRDNSSPWLSGLDRETYPIRHGEGRFITASPRVAEEIRKRGLIALTYEGANPNGSEMGIAGITDTTGRVLGMMPHPEAFLYRENHPRWTRGETRTGAGLRLFENARRYSEARGESGF